MKTYILYHGNCPDGFGAATAAWIKLGEHAEYIAVNYGNPVPELESGSSVFIVDFSYPRQQLLELAQRMKRVVVLDHHATAQQELAGLELPGDDSEIVFDMNKSGAVLAWEFFQGEDVPEFMLYLQDRDLWNFKLDKSREVSCAVRSYPMEFLLWANFTIHQDEINRLKTEGEACLRLTRQQVDNMARHHRWAYFDTKARTIRFTEKLEPGGNGEPFVPAHVEIAPVSNATVFFSEVGERLLEMYPAMDFAAYYTDRSDGKRQWGLRSRPTCDCSVIAKAFGGGGHKQASGFVL
jgi:oligoribonuclease NrnB/cAMP/cGMP phosphodiesterase (DHH superfamily)